MLNNAYYSGNKTFITFNRRIFETLSEPHDKTRKMLSTSNKRG